MSGGCYELSVKATFCAAHRVRGHRGGCANLHGHNWEVELRVSGETLDKTGFVIDFKDAKAALREILERFDHRDLNAVGPFRKLNPTSERLAAFVCREAARRLNGPACRVTGVCVAESAGASVLYREP